MVGRVAFLLLAGAAAASACPTCTISIADPDARRAIEGFQASTALLMAVPFTVLFSIMLGLAKAVRSEEARLREAARLDPAPGSPTA